MAITKIQYRRRTLNYKNGWNNIKTNVTFLDNKDLSFESLIKVSVYNFLFIWVLKKPKKIKKKTSNYRSYDLYDYCSCEILTKAVIRTSRRWCGNEKEEIGRKKRQHDGIFQNFLDWHSSNRNVITIVSKRYHQLYPKKNIKNH